MVAIKSPRIRINLVDELVDVDDKDETNEQIRKEQYI